MFQLVSETTPNYLISEANETKESNNTETVEIHAVADETSVTESSSVDGTVPVEGAKLTEDISPQSDPVAVTLEKLETLTVRDSIAVDESAVASDKLLETTMKIQQESPVKESVKIESDRPPEEDKEMIVKEEISVKPVTNGNIADEIPQSEDESEDQSGEEEEEVSYCCTVENSNKQ